MARYLGPKCKLSRREGVDLQLKSSVRAVESKCKINVPPGQHGAKRGRSTVYGFQLRAKQVLRRIYGVLERQFRRYYFEAARNKGATGEVLLQLLETRADNVLYRMGYASTRSEARQMIRHTGIYINERLVNIPSYQLKAGDKVVLHERLKNQLRVKSSVEQARERQLTEWLSVDYSQFSGEIKHIPSRSDMPPELNENAVVELYSK